MVINSFLSAEGGGNGAMTWIFVGLLVVLVIVLLVVPMFTNKKRAKQTTELHNSLKPGDVVKTVGGIIGTIKEIRKISPADTEMIIETGSGDNKTTMTFDIQALYQILSRSNSAPAPAASSDVFDETPAEKSEDKAVVADAKDAEPAEKAEEKAEVKAEEKVEEKVEDKAEEKPVEPVENDAAVEEPAKEQAATVEEKVEDKPKTPATATKAKAKSSTTHKPVQKKSTNAGGAKKSTKK